jgi:hypothetical protein
MAAELVVVRAWNGGVCVLCSELQQSCDSVFHHINAGDWMPPLPYFTGKDAMSDASFHGCVQTNKQSMHVPDSNSLVSPLPNTHTCHLM